MKYFFCLFFFCLFFCETVSAQQSGDTLAFTLNHYTDEDGLPQNSVKEIFKDEYGFVWLITEDGIVRFDGAAFRVFDKTALACIRSNRFSMMLNLPSMGAFAITEYGRRVQLSKGRAFCPPGPMIELDDLRKKWKRFRGGEQAIAAGLPQKYNFKYPDDYIIPIDLEKHIDCRRKWIYFVDKNTVDSIQFNSENGCRGFFMVGKELYYLKDSCILTNIKPERVRNCSIEGDILADKTFTPGQSRLIVLWNLAMGSTIFYYNKAFYAIERLTDGSLSTQLIYTGFDIENTAPLSHYYDKKEGRLFLGSSIHGFFVLKKKMFNVVTERKSDRRSYYAVNIYDSISLVTPQGVLLQKGNAIPLNDKTEYSSGDRLQIQLDRFGHIWTKRAGTIYRSDRKFEPLDTFYVPGEISTLYCSMDDTSLWIGMKIKGLYRLTVSEASPHGAMPQLVAKIPEVTFLASESEEKLWIGTGKGLYMLNTSSGSLSFIDQFKNKIIRSILVKSSAEIWITTYGDGIFLLRDRKLTRMPDDRNNALNAAHCMMLDQYGFFWISTNKGLIKASRKDMIAWADHQQHDIFYQYFGKESGLYVNEFNGGCQPCGTMLPNGTITFPSLDGLVQITPGRSEHELPAKALIVDKVEIDGQAVKLRDTLVVPRKFDNLSISLSTVYFGSRKNLQISYMLLRDGKEDEWYPVKGNTISFTSLPAGSYELKIRKLNGFGKGNYNTVSLKLIVPYAFYETVWFKLLIAAGLLLIVYAYIRIRLYFILQRNRLLDLKIARRTRTLTNTLRALKVSEASLRRQTQMQEMLIGAISHDIKSPMKYLTMVSKRMQQQLIKEDYKSLKAFNESIQDTAGKVYTILDNLVTYIGFQLKGGQIRKDAVDVFKLVEDKINLFAAIAATNNTTLKNSIAPGSFIEGDEALLAVIIHNLIDNAVKFTANGNIEIYEAAPRHTRFVLVIKDTGTGIPAELVHWLNTKSETGLNIETIGSHKGMGLIIIKELLMATTADLYVLSGKEGTTITMYFNRFTTTAL